MPRGLSRSIMKNSLERRILIFSLLALTLTLAVNTGFNVESFRRTYRDSILQRAQTFSNALKTQLETVVTLGRPLDEIDGIAERCQDIVKNDPEIGYCLIENSAGTVLYHSDTQYPNMASASYIGNLSPDVSILESRFLGKVYDFASPIYNYDEKVVGRVRIGFQDLVLDQLVMDHLGSTVLVLLGTFVVIFAIIVIFTRYELVLPLRRLCNMSKALADGQLDVKAPVLRTEELSQLGQAMTNMALSLRDCDTELLHNYHDLEQTNLELQKSYESLESISSELGRSREMYRSLLDDASDAILVCDDDDNLVIVNKAAERFFGLPKTRMEGNNLFSFLEMIKCRDLEQQFEWHQTSKPGCSSETEMRFWRELDQRSVLGRATTSVVVGKNGRRLVQIIVRDATREDDVRRSLERTASEMERLNQMKNSFLGLASHELKTPLTIIMGYTELLLTEQEKQLGEDTLDSIRHIAKASDRLAEIVRDMVDVSLFDGRTIELVSQDIDVNLLVQRAVDRAEASLMQRGQILRLELSKNLPLVRCDVERIVQALGNVLGNAIKFTPDKGKIIIQTKLVQRSRLPEKFSNNGVNGVCALSDQEVTYVEIAVCDKGIGIAESEQEAIFDKFYEIGDVEEHSTGKVAFKSRGAGLGLSIVKGIVDLHGGAVWVESLGHDVESMPGSTFYILLPVIDPLIL
jgi:PAS domain S-box-containing protein